MNQIYLDTARILTQVAPIVMESGVFALKLAKSSPKKFTEQANALERLLGTT